MDTRSLFASSIIVVFFAVGSACADRSIGDEQSAPTKLNDADPFVDRCNPQAGPSCSNFVEPHLCCSDDPTAIDLANLGANVTPAYEGGSGTGIPVFSGTNSYLSGMGVCVAEDSVPDSLALTEPGAEGCPSPCNPLWDAESIALVCGATAQCCQVQQLAAKDCIFDLDLGNSGCYRPVMGEDIVGNGGTDTTVWGSDDHITHQDPSGVNCDAFSKGLSSDLLADWGLSSFDVALACYTRLTVANQRGLCTQSTSSTACPYAQPSYVDACEQLNIDMQREGCD